MALSTPEDLPPNPYRSGYREGFRDGYAEGHKPPPADETGEDKKQGETDDKGKEKKGGEDSGAKKDGDDGKGKDGKDGKDEGDKDDKQDKDKQDKDKKDEKPLYKRPLLVLAAFVVLLALVIGGIIFWRHSRQHESTDDAFVDGQTSQIAAQTAGRVLSLHVVDNQVVKVGDPLIDIDSRDSDARIAESRAQLVNAQTQVDQANSQVEVRRASVGEADAAVRQAEAELTRASQDLARYQNVDPDAVARQQFDSARSSARSARAQLDQRQSSARSTRAQVAAALAQVRTGEAGVAAARATLASAELQGTYNHVVAPIAGRVTRRTVDVGNVVSSGQALMAVVSEALWITANYKETQLTRMAPGQSVDITVDAFPDLSFRGHVDSIQRGSGAYFSMLPAENATGNYVKVVQRVPVKIVFDDDRVRNYAIGPGMSVTPVVTLP